MRHVLNSIPLLYLVLLWPSRFALLALYEGGWYYAQIMFETGAWSVRLLVLAIAVSPCLALIKWVGRGFGFGRWLLQRRRHFGIASFIYAALHLCHYVIETGALSEILAEATDIDFAFGWAALVIFFILALTSNNWSVRRLGRKWKLLHYWVYPASAFAFLHWYLFISVMDRLIFWLALFVGLKLLHSGLILLSRANLTRS